MKEKISAFYSFSLLIFLALQSKAQPNLNYIPPSASASALGKFGDIPVSAYTGIPHISVPVYSYKGISNDLLLDVSLDYHAGGIRVEEVGSNIGMGWALNAGGVISRTMRGQPDDMPNNGYIALSPLTAPGVDPNTDGNIDQTWAENGYDSEQDEFFFNFNGHSGRFVVDGNGNPVLIDQEDIKIQAIPNTAPGSNGLPFQGFIVTDQHGIKYVFTDNETTGITVSPLISTTYSSSWYLTTMINPANADTIRFSYNIAGEYYQNFSEETRQNQYTVGSTISVNATVSNSKENTYTVLSKKIKKISFPNHLEMDFYYVPVGRCDNIGDSILSEIVEVDGLTGATKGMQLYESYTDVFGIHYPLSPAPCDLTTTNSSTTLRLRLDSVREFSGTLADPAYVFQYDDTVHLPARDSKQQDFWGFNNSSFNPGTTMVPRYLINNEWLDGADRRADPSGVKAGTLTQIRYPTGGTTKFNYEINRAGDNKLLVAIPVTYSLGFGADSTGATAAYTPFTINQITPGNPIDFYFTMAWCPGLSTDDNFVFSITSMDGLTTYATENFAYTDVGTAKEAQGVVMPNGNYKVSWQINAPVGTSNVCEERFGFNLGFQTSQNDSTQLAGGLRIASTVDYDGISHANDMTRTYQYLKADGSSSGTAGAPIEIGSYTFTGCTFGSTTGPPEDCQVFVTNISWLMRTATTNIPLTYTQGCSVGYSRVVITDIGPVNKGQEIDYFTSNTDAPALNPNGPIFTFNFPFLPLETQDWALGLPIRKELYDGNGRLVEKTINQYSVTITPHDDLNNFKIAMTINGLCTGDTQGCGWSSPETTYIESFYTWYGGLSQKTATTDVQYAPNGDSISNQVFYQYDPVYFNDITQETMVDSKGDTVIEYHYYPFDYTISASVFPAMVDSNMIAQRVSNETWKRLGGQYYITRADATNFGSFYGNIRPSDYYMLNSIGPVNTATIGSFNPNALLRVPSLYYEDVKFDGYDKKGNAAEINNKGSLTNYIWDINKEFPIAKVSNADSTSIAYTSFEADGTGNWTIGSPVTASGGITGTHSYLLTNGAISKGGLNIASTYVVSYWTQNGSPYSIAGTLPNYPVKGKTITINGTSWTYYEHEVSGQATVTLSGTGYIDELRLYPATAQMTTYTYIPMAGMTSSCNIDNVITYYEYDAYGRLQRVNDQDGNIIKTYQYHYKGQ